MSDLPGVPGGPEERTWTIKNVREAEPEYVPNGDPPVHLALELVVDGCWSLEPGEQLVKASALTAERERSRGLERALVEAVIPLEVIASSHRRLPYWELSPDLLDQIEKSIATIRASLSAVPDVQDDDGYEARPASPGAAREGQDAARSAGRWESAEGAEEAWWLEVQMDVFSAEEGAVVSVCSQNEDDKTSEEALVTPSPAQAREIAAVILAAADAAERHEQRADVIAARAEIKDAVPAAGARRAKADNPDSPSRPAGGTP